MKRKIISIALIILILQYFCSFVLAENNTIETNSIETNTTLEEQKEEITNKIEESSNKLEYVQTELSATMIKVQELDDKIISYEKEVAEYANKTDKLQTSINEATKSLELVQVDYDEKQEMLTNRLVALYEAGETTYIDFLLSSSNLTDFISSYYLISELAKYDAELLEEVENAKENIETTKIKLEKEQAEIKIVQAKKEQMAIVLQNTKTLQQSYITKLSSQEKELQKQIQQYKEQEAKIEEEIQKAIGASIGVNLQYTGGEMLWPVAISGTAITSYYGYREHPIQGVVKYHSGIDIGNATFGSPVVAALDGVVSYAGWLGGYGNCVIINHGNGVTTLYGHGQKVLVNLHQEVKQGDLIMEVGSTGNSNGPHLHFEVRINGTTDNPLNYVKEPK